MKKGGGSAKGSEFERQIGKTLSLWWTQNHENGPKDNIFWRTPGSGARATQREKKRQDSNMFSGDIGILDPCGEDLIEKCIFEIKRGYTERFDLLNFIDGKNNGGMLLKFWEDLSEKALHFNKFPLLIFKRNRKEICLMTTWQLFNLIQGFSGPYSEKQIRLITPYDDTRIISFPKFLEWARPVAFRK